MKKSSELDGRLINRTQIARIIFAAAESMGISDRNRIEQLTSQVIERLERPQTLPGMEHLVPKDYKKHTATEFEILSVVKEFLAEESMAKEEPTMAAKTQIASGIKLSQNALRVLERRYLKRGRL
jgi:hypothetical protein